MKRILIVDDEFGIAQALSDVLEEEGYEVSVARDGREGLERALAARPDLVMVDLMMPVLDGREMLEQMRADEALRDTPAILMSALTQPRPDKGSPYQAFLRKPFELDTLLEVVVRLVGP